MTALNSRKVFGGDKVLGGRYHCLANPRPRQTNHGGTGGNLWRGYR